MSVVGKIFDSTPSGLILAKRRDAILKVCEDNGHSMTGYKHVTRKGVNHLYWECIRCNHTVIMDFITGEDNGGALIHQCGNKPWL